METNVRDTKNFTITAKTIKPHYVEWEIVEICGRECGTGKPVYMKDGEVVELEDAESFAQGTIKWDGCSNWDFMTSECLKHFCGPDDVKAMADAVNECYKLMPEFCEKWSA